MTEVTLRPSACRLWAFQALKSAAFEERVNRDRLAADWWRERAALWFRRAVPEPLPRRRNALADVLLSMSSDADRWDHLEALAETDAELYASWLQEPHDDYIRARDRR